MLWPPFLGASPPPGEAMEAWGFPGGAGEELLAAGSEGEEEEAAGGGGEDGGGEAGVAVLDSEEEAEAEESAAMASLHLLHRLPALRGLILDGCSMSSLAWLQVRAACCRPAPRGCFVAFWGS